MISTFLSSRPRHLNRASCICVLVLATLALEHKGAAAEQTLEQIYNRIIEVGRMFPIQTPTGSIDVGTFDASTGNFVYGASIRKHEKRIMVGGHPATITTYSAFINAADVFLTFKARNATQGFRVTAEGQTVQAQSGQNSVSINVGKAQMVHWTMDSGGRHAVGTMTINRPPALGVGAFTIPAFPVFVVYDPPQGNTRGNSQSHSDARTLGVSTTMTFSGERSAQARFLSAPELVAKFNQAIGAMSAAGTTDFGPFQRAAEALVGAFPSGSFTSGDVQGSESEGTLTTEFTRTTTISTTGGRGPGESDVIAYLKNPRFVVGVVAEQLYLTLLGWDGVVITDALTLRSDITAARSSGDNALGDALQDVLEVDPFAVGRRLRGDERFVEDENPSIQIRGEVSYEMELEHTITDEDMTAEYSTRVQIRTEEPGWLNILLPFLGNTTENTFEARSTQRSSTSRTVGRKQTSTVVLKGVQGDNYTVAPYYDRIFGSFALQRVVTTGAIDDVISGVIERNGRAVAGTVVVLVAKGRRIITVTDSAGKFGFSWPRFGTGSLALEIGKVRRVFTLPTATPLRNVRVRI